jgi:outer membrane lipoprotein-sorting protein
MMNCQHKKRALIVSDPYIFTAKNFLPTLKVWLGFTSNLNLNLNLSLGLFVFTLALCLTFSLPSLHAAMSPKEILRKADEARGNAEGVEWEIDIESIERGRQQQRTIRVTARGFDSLAEFLAPANVKGQKLLMLDRNMWFAKPGLSKAVPISPRQKLLGGAANGDIASTNYAGDYQVVQGLEDMVNGEPCYLFDLTALDKRATYDRIKYWISKERLVGLRAEFYTVSGKMFKTATFEYKNSITIDGKPREFISKMIIASAVQKEDVTTMNFGKVLIKKVPDSIFNLNLLLK